VLAGYLSCQDAFLSCASRHEIGSFGIRSEVMAAVESPGH
jgi:hypothetical protein